MPVENKSRKPPECSVNHPGWQTGNGQRNYNLIAIFAGLCSISAEAARCFE
jgi:hypothetical protein